MNTAADTQAISAAQMQSLFQRQRDASRMQPYPSLKERREHLDTLIALLEDNEDAIAEAINTDFGNRPSQETRVLEMFGLLSGLRYTRKRLKKWAKPQKRHVGIAFAGAKNTVLPQPKGVVGVVTPWNYPLFLALSPATSALAARMPMNLPTTLPCAAIPLKIPVFMSTILFNRLVSKLVPGGWLYLTVGIFECSRA